MFALNAGDLQGFSPCRRTIFSHSTWLALTLSQTLITWKFLSFLPVIIVMRSLSAGEPIRDRLNRGTMRHDSHRTWRPVRGGGRRRQEHRTITADSTNWQDNMKEQQFLSPKQRRRAWKRKTGYNIAVLNTLLQQLGIDNSGNSVTIRYR